MADNVGYIYYDLKLQTADFDRKASSIGSKLNNVGKKMSDLGSKMTRRVSLPIVAGFGYMIKQASDFNETVNKIDVAFKDNATEVKKWSETTVDKIGLAQGSALDMAALFGDMGTSMGLTTKKAAEMSMSMVDLAGDLASFKNLSIDEVQTALAGIFTGETESLKRLGIVMTETNLEAYALSKGFEGNWKELKQAEKVTWRYKYVVDKTKNAQGDFARTSDSVANQTRSARERIKELSQGLGSQLLPLVAKILERINNWIKKFQNLDDGTKQLILKILGLVAVLGPLLLIFGKVAQAISRLHAVMKILKAAKFATAIFSPWTLAIGLLIAAIVLIIKNWEKVKEVFFKIWGAIKRYFIRKINEVKQAFQDLKTAVIAVWNGIKAAFWGVVNFFANRFRAAKNAVINIWNGIVGFFRGIVRGIGIALRGVWNAITAPFRAAFNWIRDKVEAVKGFLSRLNPFHRESPSLVDNIRAGTREMVNLYAKAFRSIGTMQAVIGTSGAGNSQTTNIHGSINIGSRNDADYLLKRIDRNMALQTMGVSPR